MMDDHHEIINLKYELQILRKEIDFLKKDLQSVSDNGDEVAKKVNTAWTMGRVVIWGTLGMAGFVSQFNSIVSWVRRG